MEFTPVDEAAYVVLSMFDIGDRRLANRKQRSISGHTLRAVGPGRMHNLIDGFGSVREHAGLYILPPYWRYIWRRQGQVRI